MSSVKAGTSLIITRPTSGTRVEAGLFDYRDRREEVEDAETHTNTHTYTLHLFYEGEGQKIYCTKFPSSACPLEKVDCRIQGRTLRRKREESNGKCLLERVRGTGKKWSIWPEF